MRVLVISNDVTPGFGLPVAAPGLRAAGLAAGLRDHGHDVTISVPEDLLTQLHDTDIRPAPAGTLVVAPPDLMDVVRNEAMEVVVFINANLTPHLHPTPGVHFVYDMFAPKVLEALATTAGPRTWQEWSKDKARAMALADSVWVNGKRKLGYALGWLVRPEVDHIRTSEFGLSSIIDDHTVDRLTLVEMPVPLPAGVTIASSTTNTGDGPLRLGVAGYAQAWSTLAEVHSGHQALVDAGHELHVLLPGHWGGNPDATPTSALPSNAIHHVGPLQYDDFARWVQSMDAMVDVFAPSAERRFAMITRSAVALRLGVPLIHAVDSEIADIVLEHDAGWVIDPSDAAAWKQVSQAVREPAVLARKQAGARTASEQRFAPKASLASAARALDQLIGR